MSFSILRNAAKCSTAANLLKATRQTPLKSYATVVAAQRSALVKPLVKNIAPITARSFAVSSPKLAAAGGNHTTLWAVERAVSAGLLAVIPAAFLFPSQALDVLLATSVVLHSHWGVEALIVDYMRPSVVGNVLPKVAHISLILLSIATLGGLYYFIFNDIGLANGIKKFWAIKGHDSSAQA